MKTQKINFEAWAMTAVQFIRSRGLESEFTDWSGGWQCPIKSNAFEALVEALEMVRDADEDCKRDGLTTMPPMARAKIDAALKLARSET